MVAGSNVQSGRGATVFGGAVRNTSSELGLVAFGDEALGRGDASEFVGQSIRREVGGPKGAGRQVGPGEAKGAANAGDHGRDVVGSPRIEQFVLDHGAGRDDAGDLAA